MIQGNLKEVPLNMVGSTKFGRYPKISAEQTWNLFESDGWMVPYAGFLKKKVLQEIGNGRGLFHSVKLNKMITSLDNDIYTIDPDLAVAKVGTIDTFTGDVFIAENDAKQIGICDRKDIWIYNYNTNTFTKASLDFLPNHLSFQDGYFIAAVTNEPKWRLSALNDGTSWPAAPANVGTFQTKPDVVQACVPIPGKEGHLLIMGKTCAELWQDVGYKLFPYQRSSGFNIDYGCLNPATIASGDKFVIWLGSNEKASPVIMYSDGGSVEYISSDGIDYQLAQLNYPEVTYGFLFKQDGHLFYQLTFPDPDDDLSYAYDFNTNKFFSLCDIDMGCHPAKRLVAFNNTHYFVSFFDGNLYEFNSKYTTHNEKEIVRIRITPTIRNRNSKVFIVNSMVFPIEQGESHTIQKVHVSLSFDSGVTFGNSVSYELNGLAHRQNMLQIYIKSRCNEFTPQFRFWGKERFVFTDGVVRIK